jgi:hypothetical protein
MKALVSKKLIISLLIISGFTVSLGAYLKIMHLQLANIVLCLGILLSIAFIVFLVIFFVKAEIK